MGPVVGSGDAVYRAKYLRMHVAKDLRDVRTGLKVLEVSRVPVNGLNNVSCQTTDPNLY